MVVDSPRGLPNSPMSAPAMKVRAAPAITMAVTAVSRLARDTRSTSPALTA